MTNLKSRASINSVLTSVVIAVVATFVVAARTAHDAEAGRKRVVVLDFEGPKAEKFHDDVTKLLKKTHTVISTEKWNTTAEELDATKVTEKNIKKVAKKLKIDGIIEGKIEKRRDEYLVKLKLRGKEGEIVHRTETKSESPKLDGKAQGDIKDEMVTVIDGLEANRGGGGDEEEADKPSKKDKMKKAEDDEEKPKKAKKSEDDEEKPKKAKKSEDDEEKPKKAFSKKSDDQKGGDKVGKSEDDEEKPKKAARNEEDDSPLPKAKKKAKSEESDTEDTEDQPKKGRKKVAKRGDDEEDASVDSSSDDEETSASMTSPGERAVDLTAGLSFMARRLGFTYSADLGKPPPGYKGVPVAGFIVDATLYPLAVSHKRDDFLKNIGINVMVDKVVKIQSQVRIDNVVQTLDTSTLHYSIGAVIRYPFNKTPTSPVIGASFHFGGQSFTIAKPAAGDSDIPNVSYAILDPGVFLHYPVGDKVTLNLALGFMLFTNTGDIQTNMSYGSATVTGFEGEVGFDYGVTKNIFARAAFRFETIGFKFNGKGMQSVARDADAAQDVFGARDNYLGGALTLGYAY